MRYNSRLATYVDYRPAAALLWGDAGKLAPGEFARINREHFSGSILPIPLIMSRAAVSSKSP